MPIYYYSFDSDNDRLNENATINTIEASCFESFRDELLLRAQAEGFDPDFKHEVTEGRWGDAWFKSYDGLKNIEYWDIEPFTADQLSIRKPGAHPGGNCYWITPSEPIYVVVLRDKEN